jgi:hypothetical protein
LIPKSLVISITNNGCQAGFLLPFFSGSDAASKGVLTDLVPAAQRLDALQAITFVGYVASLSTAGVFGSMYSAFAEIDQAHLTFFCNAVSMRK